MKIARGKIIRLFRRPRLAGLVAAVSLLLVLSVRGAETNAVRLAVGPFFAPIGNKELRQASDVLPDLITAELSKQGRFLLVEREKVSAIWNELHLNASGLAARETVAKLGRMLACDRFVSGSFVPTGTRTQVWAKVIDIRSGVVLDLEALPYESTNLSATVTGIAEFLGRAGSHSQGQKFITLGRFVDFSISSARNDGSRLLPALIEKHFHAAGVGVVELEAVSPIFEEYQLETAGLTGQAIGRVKLQPAFWIVDGGCEWVHDTQDKLSVALRVQKVGAEEQVFRFTALPGDELETAVVETIQKALANTNQIPAVQAAAKEVEILEARGTEMAERRAPPAPARSSASNQLVRGWSGVRGRPDLGEVEQMEENVRALNATYERALLLDSKNLKAKLMLAYGLVGDREPANRQRGKDMLREVIASGDSRFVQRAQWSLDLTDPMLRKRAVEWLGSPSDILKARGAKLLSELGPPDEKEAELERKMHQTAVDNSKRWHAEQERAERERTLVSQNGGSQLAGSPAPNAPSRTAATAAASAALPPQTNAPRAGMLVEIPAPRSMGSTFPMTAVNGGGPLLASGILLYCYNKYVNRLEPMDLPITLKHPITAIESDKLSIWLGTDGGGLAQIDRGGGPCRIYTEKDGLLMPSITVLARTGDRLWIGFGSRERGGIGYLELPAGRFVGLTNDVGLFKSPEERLQAPPDAAIQFIRSLDNKVFWIGTRAALHRFDTESRKWSTALPFAPNGLSLGLNCVAVGGPRGGVMVCKLPGDRWEQIDIDRSPELVENKVFSLRALDNSLWVGGDGKLSLIDLRTLRVVGQRKLADCREVRSILLFEKSVVFVADRMRDVGGSEMYWFPSPSLP